ncbi:sucrose phosphorylase [Demequina sp.]|uniref:sucrose phosphorylase n=1 Tax=Demequina sp. TaxID=2050685 RepID=UPI0025BCEAA8|nr:sucrose phosphorylase [Demequina sp.]
MTRNAVQLITYADRLAGDLQGLAKVMASEPWAGAFGGVHVLPFFTPFDGADAGFDPVDHTQVDPRLGTWEDLVALSDGGDVMVDIIVNHVSSSSAAFTGWLDRGSASEHDGMFLTMSTVFPDGVSEEELTKIYRPRPGLPFTPYRVDGELRLVWTTFTPQQIDIDVTHPVTLRYLDTILDAAAASGANVVRLDAVGYAIKTRGTSCFMTEDTFRFIADFTSKAHARDLEVLVEVHSYYRRQIEIGRAVDRVYDFALPPLVLHALYTGDATALHEWLTVRPDNAVTVLDTHDGIGVIDVGADQSDPESPGLLPPEAIDALVTTMHAMSGGSSAAATGAAASNLDLYQVNCTFYDAVGADDHAYLAARAIQFFVPGIPQVYYVGALAGSNDVELLERTGIGRDINRHYYAWDEIASDLKRPVVKALMALCAFRSAFAVFDGDHVFGMSEDGSTLTLHWKDWEDWAELTVDVSDASVTLTWSYEGVEGRSDDLLANPPVLR